MKDFMNTTNICEHSGDRYAAFQGVGRAEECCGPFKAEASYHWSVRNWSTARAGFRPKRRGHLYFSEEFLQRQLLLKFGHELFCFPK